MSEMKFIASIIIVSLALALPGLIERAQPPVFRVVLDPGHGGRAPGGKKKHGDRFDAISGDYLSYFAEGAAHKGLWEHILVYDIAQKTKSLLDLCSPSGDFSAFSKILARYTDETPERVFIDTTIIRGDSSDREEIAKRSDPNSEFRLYDYPDSGGNIRPGRISRINALKPHLVISLHMTRDYSKYYRGMNPVIVAPYSLLNKGLLHLQGKQKVASFFSNSKYTDWFQESNRRNIFKWFLNDSAFYFTGFPLTKNDSLDHKKFRGYRYNMVEWAYKDEKGWENTARTHPDKTPYSGNISTFVQAGKFWEREKSIYEAHRRDGGEEGFGGDNLYATTELMRYILHSLHLKKQNHPHQRITSPYISTWSVPLLVNAVAAFIELGSLANNRHRYLFTQKQDEIAEGLAVGIYSLFTGLKLKNQNNILPPKGKPLNLDKYTLPDGRSYFDAVVK